MNENRAEGLAREAKGSVAEAIGKLTGNTVTEAEGKVEKTAGKAQAADEQGAEPSKTVSPGKTASNA